ncbi:MAG: radical SAM protein [Halieaceae bacterium]|jgi:Fe-coproporphyrin III synthase|nr:radical SAM protein [Halieaceae bacterium]
MGMIVPADITGHYDPAKNYKTVVVNITNHCNLNCRHCFLYRDGNANEATGSIREEMSDEILIETMVHLRDKHGIEAALWMGGEPMLKPKLLRRLVKLFGHSTITTNGTAPLIDFGPSVLYVISLDGPEELNDQIRGEGVFQRALKNLEQLPGNFSSDFQVQSVITRSNQDRIEELVESLVQTRVGWMTFSFIVPEAGDFDNPDVWTDNHERAAAVEKVMQLRKKYPGFIRNTQRHLELMLPPYDKRVTRYCPPSDNILSLYLDGNRFDVPGCCYGNDVDCDRCGGWVVFHRAAMLEASGRISWEQG